MNNLANIGSLSLVRGGIVRVSPNQVSGLTSWFESDSGVFTDAGTTPATNGQTVQQWNNRSSSGNASQATSAARPLFVTGAFSTGQPAVRFDGSDDFMTATLTGTSARTVFFVGKSNGGAEDFEGRLFHLNTLGLTAGVIRASGSNNYAYYANQATALVTSSTSALVYAVLTLRFNSSTSADFYVNGTLVSSFDPNDTYSDTGLCFGGTGAGADNANCDIGAFANYNVALSDANRVALERYFGSKFGINVA